MDDPVYRRKYREGVDRSDMLGKIKQASDARHTQHLKGYTLGGGVQMSTASETALGAIEVGGECYVTNYFTTRLAATGFTSEGNAFVGGDVGVRLQSPTRLAPFVGVGSAVGLGVVDVAVAEIQSALGADSEDIDDTLSESAMVGVVYPEIGVHYWLNGRFRVSALARHNFSYSSHAESLEGWLVGAQIGFFIR